MRRSEEYSCPGLRTSQTSISGSFLPPARILVPSAVKRMCVMPPLCPVSRQRQLPCGSRYRPSVFLSVAGFA